MKHWYKIYIFTAVLIGLSFIGYNIVAQVATEQNLKNYMQAIACPNFVDINEMTMKDDCTGIVWARTELPVYHGAANPGYNWQEAKDACANLSPAGTFRLAKTEELVSLARINCDANNNCDMSLGAPGHACISSFASGIYWADNEFNEPASWSNYARSVNIFTGKADSPVFGKDIRLNAWCVINNPVEFFEQRFINVTTTAIDKGIKISGADKITAYNRECKIDDDCQTVQTAGSVCLNKHCTKSEPVTLSRIYSCDEGYYINGNVCSAISAEIGVTMCGFCAHKTCEQLGFNCDWHDDTCATQVNCGSCTLPAQCYEGNCCTPKTCAELNKSCGGPYDAGCGQTVSCISPGCEAGSSCYDGKCCPAPVCTPDAVTCTDGSPAVITTCYAPDATHSCPWTSTVNCETGQVCSGTACSCPATQCAVGTVSCKDANTKQTCYAADADHTCNYQVEEACPTGQTCSSGNCVLPGTAITITNTTANALTNYQVKFTLTYTGTAPTKLNITDSSGTLISYWMETIAASKTVWVKVPSIPANGTTKIYIAKHTASSLNINAENTFDLYEDFGAGYDDWELWGDQVDCGTVLPHSCWGPYDTNAWPCGAAVSPASAYGYIAGKTGLSQFLPNAQYHCSDRADVPLGFRSTGLDINDNFKVSSKIYVPYGNSYSSWFAALGVNHHYLALYNGGSKVGYREGGTWISVNNNTGYSYINFKNNWIKIDETFNNGIVKLYINDVQKASKNWTSGTYPNKLVFGFSPNTTVNDFSAYLDDIRVTKYVTQEPTLNPTSVYYNTLPTL